MQNNVTNSPYIIITKNLYKPTSQGMTTSAGLMVSGSEAEPIGKIVGAPEGKEHLIDKLIAYEPGSEKLLPMRGEKYFVIKEHNIIQEL